VSKDHPIIFSAPMVRALLEGRKTVTRRVISGVPGSPGNRVNANNVVKHAAPYLDAYCGERKTDANPRGMSDKWSWWTRDDRPGALFKVGYAPGDRLWVREAWAPLSACVHGDPGVQAFADNGFYRADNSTVDGEIKRWRPSIHMPRCASRLTLVVKGVKVERLRDISLQDVRAEGCEVRQMWLFGADAKGRQEIGANAFRGLWESINGTESWAINPWVVAISFRVVRANIDSAEAAA
jgi:hypothetical protein